MTSTTTRMRKEAQSLFRPWCGVVTLCALPLFHLGRTLSETSLVFGYLGVPMLATLSMGSEFQQHTFPLLLSQPVSRMRIWGEKLVVAAIAVLSATLVLCYSWRSGLAQNPKSWAIAGIYLLASVPSATFWTLFARSTVGGFLLNSIFPYGLILAYREEIFGPHHLPDRTTASILTAATSALIYVAAMLWLGARRLARFEVAGGLVGDDLLMAGSSALPVPWTGLLRCRPTGATLNLIRKEFRLLRTVWLITFVSLVYVTCLMSFRFMILHTAAAPEPEGLHLVLYTPVILFPPLIAILAGSLSLWEERTLGTQSWHLTFPVSARRQWLIKFALSLFTGLLGAVLLPVLAMFAIGFLFGSPSMFVEQAMAGLTIAGAALFGLPFMGYVGFLHQVVAGLLLTASLLTFASFWCACAVKGTVRSILWFVPSIVTLVFAARSAYWLAPKIVSLVAVGSDPFRHLRFTGAVSSLQSFVIGGTPLRIVTLLLLPALLLGLIQSYRSFRCPQQDNAFSMIRNLLPLALAVLLSFFSLAVFAWDNANGTIISSGAKRQYLLYVPKSYDPSMPTPLVISFHAAAAWPAAQMEISRWNDLADQQHFIVVYPAGSDDPKIWPMEPDSLASDVNFISALIDKLNAVYNLDPDRIYADGLSNGGGMAFALSCRLADRIAAVGVVAAAQTLPWELCGNARPVPTVVFHGTADRFVPYLGGSSPVSPTPFPNIREWSGRVARKNQCAGTPTDVVIATGVRRLAYTDCPNEADVILYIIEGGGHTWPGGKALPERIFGPTTSSIDATSVMWDFFVRHPLRRH